MNVRAIIRRSILALLIVPILAIATDVHRWTDANGRVHFGDRPPAAAQSTLVELRINTYSAPSIEGLAAVVGDRPASKRNRKNKVVMYSTTWCGVCRRAKQYFADHKIRYTDYDVEKSAKGKRDFERLGGGGVPVILVGKQRLNGFSAASFERIYQPK